MTNVQLLIRVKSGLIQEVGGLANLWLQADALGSFGGCWGSTVRYKMTAKPCGIAEWLDINLEIPTGAELWEAGQNSMGSFNQAITFCMNLEKLSE